MNFIIFRNIVHFRRFPENTVTIILYCSFRNGGSPVAVAGVMSEVLLRTADPLRAASALALALNALNAPHDRTAARGWPRHITLF